MATEYEKAWAEYRDLAEKARLTPEGSEQRKAKVKAHQVVLHLERQASNKGTLLDTGRVLRTDLPSKQSLQEEYLRKFDDETPVNLPEKAGGQPRKTTLQKHHKDRLQKASR